MARTFEVVIEKRELQGSEMMQVQMEEGKEIKCGCRAACTEQGKTRGFRKINRR